MDNWISIKDRLPEEGTRVIAFSLGQYTNITWYKFGIFGDSRGSIRDVTHWQPLPEPPEEVDNE